MVMSMKPKAVETTTETTLDQESSMATLENNSVELLKRFPELAGHVKEEIVNSIIEDFNAWDGAIKATSQREQVADADMPQAEAAQMVAAVRMTNSQGAVNHTLEEGMGPDTDMHQGHTGHSVATASSISRVPGTNVSVASTMPNRVSRVA